VTVPCRGSVPAMSWQCSRHDQRGQTEKPRQAPCAAGLPHRRRSPSASLTNAPHRTRRLVPARWEVVLRLHARHAMRTRLVTDKNNSTPGWMGIPASLSPAGVVRAARLLLLSREGQWRAAECAARLLLLSEGCVACANRPAGAGRGARGACCCYPYRARRCRR